MGGLSRIKFNPATKEIEIEGTEKFVKEYFDKLQALLSVIPGAAAAAPVKPKVNKAREEKPAKKARPEKKAPAAAKPPAKKERRSQKAGKTAGGKVAAAASARRGDMSKAVMALIQASPEGVTTTGLREKTGLKETQIWAIISNAKKAGKIRQEKRGLYMMV